MPATVVALPTLDALTAFVRHVLCERDSLDPEQTPLYRTLMKKAGTPCGIVFHIEGPRLLKTSAIWTAATERILFYDSTGTRFHDVSLSESPLLADATSAAA